MLLPIKFVLITTNCNSLLAWVELLPTKWNYRTANTIKMEWNSKVIVNSFAFVLSFPNNRKWGQNTKRKRDAIMKNHQWVHTVPWTQEPHGFDYPIVRMIYVHSVKGDYFQSNRMISMLVYISVPVLENEKWFYFGQKYRSSCDCHWAVPKRSQRESNNRTCVTKQICQEAKYKYGTIGWVRWSWNRISLCRRFTWTSSIQWS